MSAARACFARRGFATTTNREIADLAGITPSAIYPYFESKLALYLATTEDAVAEVATHMRAQIGGYDSVVDALRGTVQRLLALHDADPSLTPFFSALRFELSRHPEIAAAIAPHRDELVSAMVEVARLGVRRGEIDAADVPRVVTMFIACIMGLSQAAPGIPRELWTDAVAAFAQLIGGTLFRAPERRSTHGRARRRALRSSRRHSTAKNPQ